jgi:hypothetical protein
VGVGVGVGVGSGVGSSVVGSGVGSSVVGSSVGELSVSVGLSDGFFVGEGGAGSWPSVGASPLTYAGGGKSSSSTPSMARCMTAVQVSAG